MFFQINVTPETMKPAKVSTQDLEPPAVLILAPFQPQTRMNISSTVNSPASSILSIKNPGNKSINVKVTKLPPDERKISLNPWALNINPSSESELTITWTPKEAGTWRDTLQLVDSRRVKYDIAITTTATELKKGQLKAKPRVLAPSNNTNSHKTYILNNPPLPPPSTITQENKENTDENNYPKRSERKHFDIASKATEISGIFDISSFQLTPLKTDSTNIRDKPRIKITSAIDFSPSKEPITSPNNFNHNNHEIRRETFVHPQREIQFSNGQEIPSPVDTNGLHLRRETYDNPNPKFCRRELTVTEETTTTDYQDEFRDSLSPEPDYVSLKNPNFSTMINDLANFITPVKGDRLSINACSTEMKSNPAANSTFEIDKSRHEIQNETFEYESPTRGNILVNELAAAAMPISSSPVSSYQHGENVSARDVLEADLWVKDPNTCSSLFRGKSRGLGKIVEEQVTVTTTTYTTRRTINYSASTSQTAFCIEITPKRRTAVRKQSGIKRVSPIKPCKISKDRSILQQQPVEKKKTIISNPAMKKSPRGRITVPAVRIKKLSLAGLTRPVSKQQQQTKETSVKLRDSDKIIFYNPDPFAATMTEDPFLSSTLYYDDKWMLNQEIEFKKWLNELLTPPEHLSTDVDSVKIDIGKVWQSSRSKDNNVLAETREAVSARYHTNTRLNTLRKAALAMYTKPEIKTTLSAAIALVERGTFVSRQDRDLHRDIGLQKEILELFLSYNPLWLRIGLEVVYGETIPLQSNNDLVGLTKFLLTRFFTDPYLSQKHSHPTVTTLKLSTFMPNLNKFIIKKFLLIIYFLDYAKKNKLIGHDPCLYHKKAEYKESREILLTFSRLVLSGVGDITKILRNNGYIVSHKQTYLDEYDYAITDLSTGLRDGVRLCRVMELITGDKTLTNHCRVPAISRLQKVHNTDLALTALRKAGYTISGNIDAKTVADGHREKTLSLLWQIIYKFQAPRFEKSATVLQTWWRSQLWYVRTRNYLRNRKNNAATVIQCAWRSLKAHKALEALRNERQAEIKRRTDAARIIQLRWRERKLMLKSRNEYLAIQVSTVGIQRWYRNIRATRPYRQELQKMKKAVIVLQKNWRATSAMLVERKKYKNILGSVNLIQAWWRASSAAKKDFTDFQKLKVATQFVQAKWRANKSMKDAREFYLRKVKGAKTIQTWWRSLMAMKKVRNDFIIKKGAVMTISSWWIQGKLAEKQRGEFLTVKKSVIVIQRAWRRHRDTKSHVLHLKKVYKSCLIVQTWWRSVKVQRNFSIKKNSAIIIQRWYRATLLKQNVQNHFKLLKKSAIMVQKTWKMKIEVKNYSKIRKSVPTIQRWYRNIMVARSTRQKYLTMKNATLCIQSWWKNLNETWKCRSRYADVKNAVLIIQQRWRGKLLSREMTKNYQETRKSIIKIQSNWRMINQRRIYLEMIKRNRAAIIIQRKWRANKIGESIKKYFEQQKSAVLIIQRKYRATIEARNERKKYLELYEASVKLQRRWRAKKIGKKTRDNYVQVCNACRCLQANWRMFLVRRNFIKQKSACLIIQKKYRAAILAREVKKSYQELRESAVKLQRRWRARKVGKEALESYKKIHHAVLIIQRRWKASVEAKKVRNNYLNLHQAAVKMQQRWRARQLGKKSQEDYQRVRDACICLQANWRMFITKRNFEKQKIACLIIQRKYRATIAAREAKKWYNSLQQLTIKLQRIWKAKKIGKMMKNNYLKIRSASVCIQKNWKMIIAMREYRKQKSAVVLIQRKYRANIAARETRKEYLDLRGAAKKLQECWRAIKLQRETRASYLKLREASICLQSNWRMIKARKNYVTVKNCTINIQRRYRAKKIGEKNRGDYLKLREGIIAIQRQWRLKLDMKKRENTAASVIQCWWQSIRLTRNCQLDFKIKQKAIITIQQHYRAYKTGSIVHNDYKNIRKSVIKIQRIWRQLYEVKREKELLEKLKTAVLIIENWWINVMNKKQTYYAEKQQLKLKIKSIIKIQSYWRGYKIRKLQSPEITELRERSKKANETATPTATVEHKLRDAMTILQNYHSVGQLSMGLACIDTLTKLSPSGCLRFCQNDLVEKIYSILEESNRSLPWMDVCLRCTNILITLAKLPSTSHFTRQIYYMETIARLMSITIKREHDLFLHLSTLLWLIAGDENFADEIVQDQRTIWLIKTVCGTAMKGNLKGNPQIGGAKRPTSIEKTNLLPNTRPDWGFQTKRPRTFTTIHHAVTALMAKFKITQVI